MALNLGALAGGIGIGYERQSRLQMDEERNKKAGVLADLQISEAKRREDEAARDAETEAYIRKAGMDEYEKLNPREPAPAAPTNDDDGNPLPPEALAPGAGIKKEAKPPKDEWAQKPDTMEIVKARQRAAMDRQDNKRYQAE
ncbi:MAG: hypothetical protein WCI73_14310, partial [Phycisphaerae bacterium]